jgi:glycosyltransferase involved in cell wall biosynthesis
MKILAMEPYYGGSHKAFIDGLSKASRHNWTLLTLPAHRWKWRMRHSAITFAAQVAALPPEARRFDLLFCSDMLNLAEFVGLSAVEIARLPKVIYFHENQLTYPVRFESERDRHFGMTNLTSALAADAVWFNSQFHADSFLSALPTFLKSMPDHEPLEVIEKIRAKSSIHPPGIAELSARKTRTPGPLRILWAARWEHDKNPEDFFAALAILKAKDIAFRVSVIGQSFQDVPEIFNHAQADFAKHIDLWGYQQNHDDYVQALCKADVIVSTANHEFYGIGIIEGLAAGVHPLVPERLSYPEILGLGKTKGAEQFFYDGSVSDLAAKLGRLAARIDEGTFSPAAVTPGILTDHLTWDHLTELYDEALERLGSLAT